jgi:CHAT domain
MANSNVLTCTLTLSPTKVSYRDRLAQQQPTVNLDSDTLRADIRDWLIQRIEDKREDYDEVAARLLGRHLYELVFRGVIRTRFKDAMQFARDDQALLRLEFVFTKGTSHLARLPWEFLYPNEEGGGAGFLAGEVDVYTLTRFIDPPLTSEQRPKPIGRALRVLVVVSVPDRSGDPFSIPEIKNLSALLQNRARSGGQGSPEVEVHRLPNPTYDDLLNTVIGKVKGPEGMWAETANPWLPDVVHIVGEGVPGAIQLQREAAAIESEQAVADSARLARLPVPSVTKDESVGAERLRALFMSHPPKFVFLQTCFSGRVDGNALFMAAEGILKAGVPAVLAMQYDIEREAADSFAHRVYQELLAGKAIDVAVVHGRNRLREGSVSPHSAYRAFGTPVIYLGHDGPLVERHPEAPAPIREKKVAPGDAVSNRQCPRCHTPCLYLWCPTCALLFDCPDEKCGTPYENPLGKLCGKCGRKIEQEPWEPPVGDPVQPGPSRARDIQAPAWRSSGRPTQERPSDVLRQKGIFSSPADDEAGAQ